MTEKSKNVIILWQWHLAVRLKKILDNDWINAIYFDTKNLEKDVEEVYVSNFEKTKNLLEKNNIRNASEICILDDDDEHNIELALIVFSICKKVPIIISLFNKWLWIHLKAINNNIKIINPAKIAAPHFVKKYLDLVTLNENRSVITKIRSNFLKNWFKFDTILLIIFTIFSLIFLVWIIFFKYSENLSWIDSIYFSSATISSVWYWDINLRDSSNWAKIFWIFFILASMMNVWIFFSMLIERLIKKRYEIELGRMKYNMSNHIIVCWLGRIWLQMVEELILKWKEIIIIEENIDNRYLELIKSYKIKVFIWDATIVKNLLDIWIQQAEWIFVMSSIDMKNLQIWLSALQLNPNITTVLRIYDESLAKMIRSELKLPLAYSTIGFASEYILKLIKK